VDLNKLNNLRKLFKGSQEDIKLATNIVVAQTDTKNVIAVAMILKDVAPDDVRENEEVIEAINSAMSVKMNKEFIKSDGKYEYADLLKAALHVYKSKVNIEAARMSYRDYINSLCDQALESIGLGQEDLLPQGDNGNNDDDPFAV